LVKDLYQKLSLLRRNDGLCLGSAAQFVARPHCVRKNCPKISQVVSHILKDHPHTKNAQTMIQEPQEARELVQLGFYF
jgi:hypothetical protein